MRKIYGFLSSLMFNKPLCSDKDAKQRWANNVAGTGWNMGMGGFGGRILSGVVRNSVGKVFG